MKNIDFDGQTDLTGFESYNDLKDAFIGQTGFQ